MYCDVDIYFPGKDLPGVYFLQLKHFTLIFKKIHSKHTQKKKQTRGKKRFGLITEFLLCCINVCKCKKCAFLVCFHMNECLLPEQYRAGKNAVRGFLKA